MSEKLSEKSEMSELAFASNVLRKHIAPPGSAASKGERILAAALALRWKPSRTKDVWYGDSRVSLKPKELRRIEKVSGIVYGREELKSVDALIARADALLVDRDADLDRSLVSAFRAFLGALDRAGTGGRGAEHDTAGRDAG